MKGAIQRNVSGREVAVDDVRPRNQQGFQVLEEFTQRSSVTSRVSSHELTDKLSGFTISPTATLSIQFTTSDLSTSVLPVSACAFATRSFNGEGSFDSDASYDIVLAMKERQSE